MTKRQRAMQRVLAMSATLFGSNLNDFVSVFQATHPGIGERVAPAIEQFGRAAGVPRRIVDLSDEMMQGFSGAWLEEVEAARAAESDEDEREQAAAVADYQRVLAEWELYEPSAAEIDEKVSTTRESEHEQFASDLETARAMFRAYPELVTADEFPAEHIKALRSFVRDWAGTDAAKNYSPNLEVRDSFMRPVTAEEREHAREFLKEHRRPKPPRGVPITPDPALNSVNEVVQQ